MTSRAKEAPPNLYELRGKGIQVVYWTSSINGKPLLQYRGKPRNRSFSGGEIRVQATEIGRLVTVLVEQVPDLRVVTLTLLIPSIHLEKGNATFHTSGILTTHRTTIAGPAGVKGPVQTYEVLPLEGKARIVRF